MEQGSGPSKQYVKEIISATEQVSALIKQRHQAIGTS